MTSPLAGGIAKTVGRAFKNLFLDAKLIRAGASTGDVWNPAAGVSKTYSCKAIFDEWGSFDRANGLVSASDRKVLVLAASLDATPQVGDKIVLDGLTLTIVSDAEGQPGVSTDPAKAIWVIRARV